MSSSRLHSVRTGAFRPAARAALAISQASTTIVARAREAPAEAAARHLHMHRHLLGLEAQHARRRGGVQPGALRADPQLGARRR